jgi:hypothetical protein
MLQIRNVAVRVFQSAGCDAECGRVKLSIVAGWFKFVTSRTRRLVIAKFNFEILMRSFTICTLYQVLGNLHKRG